MNGVPKIAEVRVNKITANVVGGVLTVLFCLASLLLAYALPHYRAFADWHFIPFLLCLAVLAPLHELLHAIGLVLFARVSWSNIKFGVVWRALMPYCHCTVPITVAAFRRMALLPMWVTGTASVAALLAFPTAWLAFFTGITVAACVGDVWMVAKVRGYADHWLVQDSPTEIGCDVYSCALEPTAGARATR